MGLCPVLPAALAAAFALGGCGRGHDARALRLGYLPNLTHAQALVGLDDGTFQAALGGKGKIEARMFNAGPAAMEALLAGELDVAYVGPGPAITAFLRSRGEALLVVAGAASGGAVLAVRDARRPADLAGKRVASPQLGNTQDVALRVWLRAQGLSDDGGPRGVTVTPLSNADILSLFTRGDLAGAWVPEPWGARLVAEAGAKILVDERTLWPGGRFPSTLLVVSRRALESRSAEARALLRALLRAHVALTRRWERSPRAFARLANEAYARRSSKPLPDGVLMDAFSRIEPSVDPFRPQLAEMARRAQALGFAPAGDVTAMVDETLLRETASPPASQSARPSP